MAENNTKNQVKELTDKLEQGVKELFESEKFMAYLKTMSRFTRYSTRNTLLIHMQMPDASLVAGYQAWQSKFGRFVKKGEKGIKILAPTPFTIREERQKLDPDTKIPVLGDDGLPQTEMVEKKLARFKAIPVFDVSQTDGKPLPMLAEDLTGDVRYYELFMDTLRAVSPLPIGFEPLKPGTDGECHMGKKIAIREGMSEIQTVCAVIHEITHAKLHDIEMLRQQDETVKPKDRATEEVEAESVSYTVCQYYGIETGANSFGYLADWSKDRELKELNASLDTIRKTSSELIEGIDKHFHELAKERGIDLTAEPPECGPSPEQPSSAETSTEVTPPSDLKPNQHIEVIDGVEFVVTGIGPRQTDTPEQPKEAELEQQPGYEEWSEPATAENAPELPGVPSDDVNAYLQETELTTEENTTLDIFPDTSIGLSERDLYGYTDPSILPLHQERALELFEADHTIYMLYDDNTEAMVFDRDEIITFTAMNDGIFGIDAAEWRESSEYKRLAAEQNEGTREAALLYGENDSYGIYQLKSGDELHYHRFTSLEQLEKDGLTVERDNYALVYTAPLSPDMTLDGLYSLHNRDDRPAAQEMTAMSMSDVVVLRQDGEVTSHYVDSRGFIELPAFVGNESPPQAERETSPQVGNMLPTDGPTVAELKAEVDAGRQISLASLANAVHNERQQPPRKERSSLLAQLQEYKTNAAQGADSSKSAPKHDANREV